MEKKMDWFELLLNFFIYVLPAAIFIIFIMFLLSFLVFVLFGWGKRDPCEGKNCGNYGSCKEGKCVCNNNYTGKFCGIPPSS